MSAPTLSAGQASASVPLICRWDLRVPGLDGAGRREVYQRMLEQARYADPYAMAYVVSEHHAAPDGYLPSPLPVAAALAAVTEQTSISVAALLANFYDPVRLAEDISVLDHLSGGRVTYTVGLGYRRPEYDLYGVPWAARGAELEERLQVVLDLLAGRRTRWQGRDVAITPRPEAMPVIFYGGGTLAAAKRAARLGLHFQPQVRDKALRAAYDDACQSAGRPPGMTVLPMPGPISMFCAESPDAFWEEHGSCLLADATAYEDFREADNSQPASAVRDASRSVEELRTAGTYVVWTPEEFIARCRSGATRAILTHPACGGLPPEPSWQSLKLICETVLPALGTGEA